MDLVIEIITLIYLLVMGVIDKKYKKIPVLPGILYSIVVIIWSLFAERSVKTVLCGTLIAIFLFVVSKLSRGSVGEADALVYLVTGLTFGFFRNLEILLLSLFFASVTGVVLLFAKKVNRHYKMPFIPFTAAACGIVMAAYRYV